MAIVFRPALTDDLAPGMAAVHRAMNDLANRHGVEGLAAPPGTEFHVFSLMDDPGGLWVAEDAGQIIGIGFSWVCDGFWFLADLFVVPEYQGRGVGGELLQRALDHAEANRVTNKALITFAYNRTSIALYAKRGFFPRVPLYKVSGRTETLRVAGENGLSCIPINGSPEHFDAVTVLDRACVGFSREKHHRCLEMEPAVRGFLLEAGGALAGYAYLWSDGHIGPLAVTSTEAMGPAFRTMLGLAKHEGTESISAFLAGSNEPTMSIALQAGLRIERPMVLLSSNPFGDWTRYLPNHPGFM